MKLRLKDHKNSTEILKEIAKTLDVLTYRPEDAIKYEMVYYGELWSNLGNKNRTYLRLWHDGNYYYKSIINGKEMDRSKVCDEMTVAQVRRLFMNDLKKIKLLQVKEKLKKIKQDF